MFVSLYRLKSYISPYRFRMAAGITAFGIARLFEALIPLFVAMGIDRISNGQPDLIFPVFGIIIAVIGRYIVVTFARFSVRKTGQYVAFDLRESLFLALQKQGSKFFSQHTIGDMMTRAIADISLIQRLISMGTILVIILLYAGIVGFGFMWYISPSLTLLLLPPIPLVFIYALWSARQMGVASKEVQDRMSDLGAQVQENLSGIRTIQAMVQEEREVARFGETNQSYANSFYWQSRIGSLMASWMPTIAAICSITILGFGGFLVLDGEMSVGELVAFFMYVNMVVQPFRVAGFIVNLFQRAAVASDRLFEVLKLEPEIKDDPKIDSPSKIEGDITIKGLTFTYNNALKPTLDNINIHIKTGESIAIMGRVGSGKTTLLKQLVRLIDTPNGTIFIDGFDICDYPLSQIRSQIVLVPQDTFLFGEPLGNNLTYDNPYRPITQIWTAAKQADLDRTIKDFPEEMATIVGERGVTLSGGQKQRATLARGLIRKSPILILDDCFSSVDTQTEERILEDLHKLRKGQTTLLVSHRVSTAKHSDRIVVLDSGRVVEQGSHDALIKENGIYAEFERIQREGARESDYLPLRTPS